MKIKGYTLHGDYYLADKVITCTNWEEACEMKEVITLPNGKTAVAHILTKKELETIPQEEREFGKWYWTSTICVNNDYAWYMNSVGDLSYTNISHCGNVRLAFHKNEIKQFLDVE